MIEKLTADQRRIIFSEAGRFYAPLRDEWPDRLCHYTDVYGLAAILGDGVIRLSHGKFLNDPEELVYGNRIRRQFLQEETSASPVPDDFLRACLAISETDNWISDVANSYYCACFSEAIDDLGQFRLYADQGAGFCLVFDTDELYASFKPSGRQIGTACDFDLIRCQYDPNIQVGQIRTLYQKSREIAISSTESKNSISQIAQAWKIGCDVVSMAFKQPGFRGESEWRVAVSPANLMLYPAVLSELQPNVAINSRTKTLTPFILANSGNGNVVDSLKEIIVGPRQDFANARMSLDILLSTSVIRARKDEILISRSNNSYR